jgi:hypothetical protein
MYISPRFALIAAAPFTLLCLGVALYGFMSMAELTDPQQIADARGYIGFWLILAVIAVVCGVVSWWLMSAQHQDGEG